MVGLGSILHSFYPTSIHFSTFYTSFIHHLYTFILLYTHLSFIFHTTCMQLKCLLYLILRLTYLQNMYDLGLIQSSYCIIHIHSKQFRFIYTNVHAYVYSICMDFYWKECLIQKLTMEPQLQVMISAWVSGAISNRALSYLKQSLEQSQISRGWSLDLKQLLELLEDQYCCGSSSNLILKFAKIYFHNRNLCRTSICN